MPRAFAEFEEYELDKIVTRRRDTRLYFGEQDKLISRAGRCVGAFFLQNPGSASPTTSPKDRNGLNHWPWGALDYSQEQLMPVILSVLDTVLNTIRTVSPKYANLLELQGYVQLLNISYIKNPPDFKTARSQWEQILQEGMVCDDSPSDFSDFRFIVFGWGKDIRKTFEGARVARLMDSWGLSKCSLIFPESKAVRSQGELKIIDLELPTLLDWQSAIGEKNNYPCGGQHERHTYPELYVNAVSPILAEALQRQIERHVSDTALASHDALPRDREDQETESNGFSKSKAKPKNRISEEDPATNKQIQFLLTLGKRMKLTKPKLEKRVAEILGQTVDIYNLSKRDCGIVLDTLTEKQEAKN